jgi:TolB-like protein/DNA-binding winged helix-turn-helix (wHTH) protein
MSRPPTPLQIGAWRVDPGSGEISRKGETVHVEARTMRLLVYLAERPRAVVSIDELLKAVWPGVIVTSDSVYQAVTSLRRTLGDDAKQPAYIATVPRLGYRLVASVGTPDDLANHPVSSASTGAVDGTAAASSASPARPDRRRRLLIGVAAAATGLALVTLSAVALHGQFGATRPSPAPVATPFLPKSVAVVPFIDLTAGMSHEYFADGITEEVIDKLSKAPNIRVAAPTSSFYIKNKPLPVTEIARTLHVGYVLDGSVRKSGPRLRVAARLSRGDDGYVVWSDTYDRPLGDILAVQDDIARDVARALEASIESPVTSRSP